MKAIKFKNFSTSEFTWSYDSVPYTFPAGSEMFLEDYKVFHFAKHLIDRELNNLGIPTNQKAERTKLEKLCFPTDEAVTPLEALQIEETKKVKKVKKVVKTEEFEQ